MPVKMEHRTLEDKILLTITATATLVLSPFLIMSVMAGDIAHIAVDSTAVGGFFAVFLGVWFTSNVHLFSGIFALLAQVTILIGIHIKGMALIYWLFPIIIASFYLLPTALACIFNFILISVGCFLISDQFDTFTFPRLLAAFIVTNIFALIFSVFMQNKNRQLLEKDKTNQHHNTILELIASSSNLANIFSAIVDAIEDEFPNVRCSILLVDKSRQGLELGAAPNLPEAYHRAIEALEVTPNAGYAVATGTRVIIDDLAAHSDWPELQNVAKSAQLVSCWSEPILGNQGNILGSFDIFYRKRVSPKPTEFKLIEQFVNLARIAIERDKTDRLIWQQANYDHLTGLPNRNLLHEHLAHAVQAAKRDEKQLAIAMLDLDKFKYVNDTFGHNAGDKVLIECSQRIQETVRETDIAARLGGDEFIIVLLGTQSAEIDSVANKLLNALAQPYAIQGESAYCTASIGIAFYPSDAATIDSLLKCADQAMYQAKLEGRNSAYYFADQPQAQAT
ncbi:sensor domain-containing diguanylate cyclase [Marinomonas pollencensis]|uniref:Diguanylate cyclase (GGDEF)-like protein n=1 Tax=Marinomonas pollencensis TaxID=491954 RepID=A0A3E0DLB9_9GAMM|nr:sensor domain-containing diguanylate cyclase [Marinomonas pollencensis]REG82894.1 diguanylate cyclase (GGDEF)-like protein [Marinomonas pollencensis]